jgi:hypothetical protein
MNARGTAQLGLRARLQGHGCQRECGYSQSYRDFSHKTFLLSLQDCRDRENTQNIDHSGVTGDSFFVPPYLN